MINKIYMIKIIFVCKLKEKLRNESEYYWCKHNIIN
jgi:hypothetical protein